MLKRFLFLAAMAAATLAAGDAVRAQSATTGFASYNQTVQGTSPFTYAYDGSVTTIKVPSTALADSTAIDFNVVEPSFLQSGASSSYNNASFSLTAQSMQGVSTSPFAFQGGFMGTFNIVQGANTIAAGNFTGTLVQVQSGQASLQVSIDPGTFVSTVFKPLKSITFNVAASGVPTLVSSNGGQSFQNFTGAVAGTFAGSTAVPEPATLAMVGFGLLGLPATVLVTRRRRTKTDV